MLELSVVVCCISAASGELERCLASLAAAGVASAQIIVVDNARAADAQTEAVAQRYRSRYVHESQPGLGRARNRGLQEVQTTLVAFVDDDAVVDAEWARAMSRTFASRTEVSAVSGRTLPLAVRTEAQQLFHQRGGYDAGELDYSVDKTTPGWFEMTALSGIGSGTNIAFRTAVLRSFGGFDPRLGRGAAIPGAEEHKAFFEVIDRGGTVAYVSAAIVYHDLPETLPELVRLSLLTTSISGAMASMFFFEHRAYSRRVVQYYSSRFSGVAKAGAKISPPLPISGKDVLAARLRGVRMYFEARNQR